MGLQLTLDKEKNQFYYTFVDAYWCVKEIAYSTEDMYARLVCYPNRESSHKQGTVVPSALSVGGSYLPVVDSAIYHWQFTAKIVDVFPNGIPLNENEQKTAIYNWVKAYTGIPFEDVLEEE